MATMKPMATRRSMKLILGGNIARMMRAAGGNKPGGVHNPAFTQTGVIARLDRATQYSVA
jgi:hypothetical protein